MAARQCHAFSNASSCRFEHHSLQYPDARDMILEKDTVVTQDVFDVVDELPMGAWVESINILLAVRYSIPTTFGLCSRAWLRRYKIGHEEISGLVHTG